MPARNSIKQYVGGGIYHIYNRGVAKSDVFLDARDYKTFLFFLKIYLIDPEILRTELQGSDPSRIERKNFLGKIDLLAYCLMPNHFHLLVKQKNTFDITEFMRCVITNYVMYFNKRYNRVGTLFQGKFKAVLTDKDEYLLHISRYIHLNPVVPGSDPSNYDYSSYSEYLGRRNTKWINPRLILDIFNDNAEVKLNKLSYKKFVEENQMDSGEILGGLTLE